KGSARRRVTQFGFVPQSEKRLLAPGCLASANDGENIVLSKIWACESSRRFRESAVMADVAAELSERYKYFSRIAHRAAELGERLLLRRPHESVERRIEQEKRLRSVRPPAGRCIVDYSNRLCVSHSSQ